MPALTCTSCGANLDPDGFSADGRLAICPFCRTANHLAPDAHSHEPRRQRYELEPPDGFSVDHDGQRLRITRRWRTWLVIPLLVGVALWDLVAVVPALLFLLFALLGLVLGVAGAASGEAPALVFGVFGFFGVLVSLAFVGIGLFFNYFALALSINRTVIELDEHQLRVHHGPLPWPGKVSLRPADIEQLYCKASSVRTEHGSHPVFHLHAGTVDGKHRKLLPRLANADQAVFVEQQLEKAMGIADRPVAGEVV